ncbi:MAG: TIGR01459 family HAD-type hydrolase [Nitratireductor sp.]
MTSQLNSQRIDGLNEIADNYDLILCDVWGVLHNGVKAYEAAVNALSSFRKNGGTVVMVTNAPRPRAQVYEQLKRLGVPDGVFDRVITSGDVTQALMADAPKKVHFIGMYEKDKHLFEGQNKELVSEEEAEVIVCTGPLDEYNDTAQTYTKMLERCAKRDLDFICANPDKVVEVGDKLIMCGGAIADEYERIGGTTLIAGKPFAPIYKQAILEAEELSEKQFAKDRMLAIGDGMPTDIKGAQDFGLDVLYVSAGIHAAEYGEAKNPIDSKVQSFLKKNNAKPVAYIPHLSW